MNKSLAGHLGGRRHSTAFMRRIGKLGGKKSSNRNPSLEEILAANPRALRDMERREAKFRK